MAEPRLSQSGTRLIADSHITMYKEVTSAFVNAQDALDVGVILQWMDIAACLAAERHTKTSSVTLSMDDLHFDTTVPLGSTVRLDATIHKVFGTSMEVGCSVAFDQQGRPDRFVCAACFTFVALGPDGKKMRVQEALAVSLEEQFLSTLAAERRAWRLKRSALEEELCARRGSTTLVATQPNAAMPDRVDEEDGLIARGGCFSRLLPSVPAAAVPTELVSLTMTQLVLPQMANHHGNTFGGQVRGARRRRGGPELWPEASASALIRSLSHTNGWHPSGRARGQPFLWRM